jgi:hypothetical protein
VAWENPDFTNAKVGDKVFVCERGSWGLRRMAVATIDKVGKLHVTVRGNKYRFTGSLAGNTYQGDYLRPFDQGEWEAYQSEVYLHTARVAVRNFAWHNCDKEIILKVYAIIERGAAQSEPPRPTT